MRYLKQPGTIAGAAVTLILTIGGAGPATAQPPQLLIEAPDSLAPAAARIRQFDRNRLLSVMRLTGLEEAGPPIRVILAPERSLLARSTPSWIAGFAHPDTEAVVLFPSRAPSYPDDSLETLLHHEVAHILIARAAGGRDVPRWFNEGLATTAERTWALEDRTRLAWALVRGGRVPVGDLDDLFQEGPRTAARAYALSGALVRDLLQTHGSQTAGQILSLLARDRPFEDAFYRTTRTSLAVAERAFWERQRLWEAWIPFLTSSYVLWMAATLLALYAIVKRRQKSAALRKKWEEEEAATWEEPGAGQNVH